MAELSRDARTLDGSQISEALLALARLLVARNDLNGTLAQVAEVVCNSLPGCDGVGVTLEPDGETHTAVHTADWVAEVDQVQYDLGAGPGLAAMASQAPVRVDHMPTEERWPDFASAAAARRIGSSLSQPLAVDDRKLGALNIYSHTNGRSTPSTRTSPPRSRIRRPSVSPTPRHTTEPSSSRKTCAPRSSPGT